MANVAILQPYRPDLHPALLERAGALLDALVAAHPEHTCTVVRYGGRIDAPPGAHRYHRQVVARNTMLDTMLPAGADLVMWVDADLTDYPPDLLRRLLATGADIAAPAVLLEGTDQFYDVGGFIEAGRPLYAHPPYVRQEQRPVVDLESVGCVYVAPAYIYRDWGLRFAPIGPVYEVEHPAVNMEARRRGLRVVADLSIVARHAYLPRFGEAWH